MTLRTTSGTPIGYTDRDYQGDGTKDFSDIRHEVECYFEECLADMPADRFTTFCEDYIGEQLTKEEMTEDLTDKFIDDYYDLLEGDNMYMELWQWVVNEMGEPLSIGGVDIDVTTEV